MPITPSGSPAWTRTNTHVDYGGDLNKRNFLSQGVIDPQTDVGADQFSRIVADMEAIARVSPFAVITYQHNDSSPAAPTVLAVYGMIGVRTTSYAGDAAPAGFPSALREGAGIARFTFAASYADAYGVSGAFALRHAIASPAGATVFKPTYTFVSATDVRIVCQDSSASPSTDKQVTLVVW
jgi:hypothetical protein